MSSLNRIDIQTSNNEAALLNALSRGDLQLLPQLGPRQMAALLTDENSLKPNFSGNHTLYEADNPFAFHLRYNTQSDRSKASVTSALAMASNQPYFENVPGNNVQLLWTLPDSANATPADTLISSYSDNPIIRDFYSELSSELANSGIHFEMSPLRIATRSIDVYPDHPIYFMDAAMRTTPSNTLLSVIMEKVGVSKQQIQNVQFNTYPWWINLRETTLSTNNR